MRFFNIFNTYNLHNQIYNSNGKINSFGSIALFAKSNNFSLGEISYLYVADPIIKQIALMHYFHQKLHKQVYLNIMTDDDEDEEELRFKHLQIGTKSKDKFDI